MSAIGCNQPGQEAGKSASNQSPQIQREQCITAKAVVSYYLPEGRTYLTDQDHLFCPDTGVMQIRSREPQGVFVWTWAGRQLSENNPSQAADAYWEPAQIAAVCTGFFYGGGFFPSSDLKAGQMIRLEGQRYIPIQGDLQEDPIQIIMYRNQDTQQIDRILVEDKNKKKIWMAMLYNWSFYGINGNLIPRKMDIFDITDGVSSKKLIIQLDYKQVL
jgi:hypothetical protein